MDLRFREGEIHHDSHELKELIQTEEQLLDRRADNEFPSGSVGVSRSWGIQVEKSSKQLEVREVWSAAQEQACSLEITLVIKDMLISLELCMVLDKVP